MTIETGEDWGGARGGASRLAGKAVGTGLIAAVALVGVALGTWNVADPSLSVATGEAPTNWLGAPGAVIADLLMQVIGLATLAFVAVPLLWGFAVRGGATGGALREWPVRVAFWLVGTLLAAATLGALPATEAWPLPTGLGGVIGDLALTPFGAALGGLPEGFASILLALPLGLAARFALARAASLDPREEDEDTGSLGRIHGSVAVAVGSLTHGWYMVRSLLARVAATVNRVRDTRRTDRTARDAARADAAAREADRAAREADAQRTAEAQHAAAMEAQHAAMREQHAAAEAHRAQAAEAHRMQAAEAHRAQAAEAHRAQREAQHAAMSGEADNAARAFPGLAGAPEQPHAQSMAAQLPVLEAGIEALSPFAASASIPPAEAWNAVPLAAMDRVSSGASISVDTSDWTEERMRLHGLLPPKRGAEPEAEPAPMPEAPRVQAGFEAPHYAAAPQVEVAHYEPAPSRTEPAAAPVAMQPAQAVMAPAVQVAAPVPASGPINSQHGAAAQASGVSMGYAVPAPMPSQAPAPHSYPPHAEPVHAHVAANVAAQVAPAVPHNALATPHAAQAAAIAQPAATAQPGSPEPTPARPVVRVPAQSLRLPVAGETQAQAVPQAPAPQFMTAPVATAPVATAPVATAPIATAPMAAAPQQAVPNGVPTGMPWAQAAQATSPAPAPVAASEPVAMAASAEPAAAPAQPAAPVPAPASNVSVQAPGAVVHAAPRGPVFQTAPLAAMPPAAHTLPAAPKGAPEVFTLPSLDYLRPPVDTGENPDLDPDVLRDNAVALESVLADFGVKGSIIDVQPGPVVTLYLLEPAPGIKSSRVIGLAEDIARSMSAIAARVAVVPGRNAIGIELPNASREMVMLREIIERSEFSGSSQKLAMALGKDIGGTPVVADLAKMPHLLVAGTTGSGKSVAINTMILSMLYRMTPAECRLIMIDPKMLELSVYDGIPHLLSPVVTDPKKAVVALKWCVREMEERYKKMSKLGVRNVEGFNARVKEAKRTGESLSRTVQTGFDRTSGEAIYETEELDAETMPFIVVIIDEMADLMMVAGKDIEGAVQRLAQMARAAGIHVVMATQRPSTDVITGTIKANFPTRISFQVTSKIDSRVMLGEAGAEQLLGMGDMLYMTGGGRTQRVHGPFVSDEEVEEVVRYLKTQGVPDYLEDVTLDDEEEDEDTPVADNGAATAGEGMEGSDDPYDQAVALVARDGKASTSYVQRRLGIGYNRAATLIERMEKEGVISKPNSAGKREVLLTSVPEPADAD